MALLSAAERRHGVVAASTGNHGRALAHAAAREGLRAVICMSRLVPANKVDEIRRLGAEVRIVGASQDDAQEEVERLVAEEGLAMVPPFDAPAVVAGQGTLGLEILAETPEAETVVVPLSGGGLAAGIAVAVKALKPAVRVIGVSMARGAAMQASIEPPAARCWSRSCRRWPTRSAAASGSANRLTFALCRDLLDEVVLLSEAEIAAGIVHAYFEEREIVEGAGAVGIGALLAGKLAPDRADRAPSVRPQHRHEPAPQLVSGDWRPAEAAA